MAKNTSIISLDPIDRTKKIGIIEKFLITRWYSGKPVRKSQPFGHYMFCGAQGNGKTASALWYAENLAKKYSKKGYEIEFYSNIGVGKVIEKEKIFEVIDGFDTLEKKVRIVILDEIQTYFPKESTDKKTKALKDDLVAIFSQLRKRSTFVISTAQIYGRLDKSLREQCLFMIDCHLNFNKNKLVNNFIQQEDILCDELGRWAGRPKKIYIHGLSKLTYDTKRIIRV